MESFPIRKAEARDIPTLVAHNRAMALETEGKTLDLPTVERGTRAVFEDDRHGFYLVAEQAGKIVGQLMITYEWSDWRAGEFWWLQSVYVAPEKRRHGVFRALYRHLGELAEKAGNVSGFRLYVDQDNRRAQETYAKIGMEASHYRCFEVDFVFGANKDAGLVKVSPAEDNQAN